MRLYAEDPGRDFRPSSGLLTEVAFPADARVETWVETRHRGHALLRSDAGEDHRHAARPRADAIAKLQAALDGPSSAASRPISTICASSSPTRRLRPRRDSPRATCTPSPTRPTPSRSSRPARRRACRIPGRVGYWDVGVPPSGPMDPLAFRLANRLVGNAEGAAGAGDAPSPARRCEFNSDAVVCLGRRRACTRRSTASRCRIWQPIAVTAGADAASSAASTGPGARAYLAVRGGIDVPDYLGSRVDLHPRQVRRPRRPGAAHRRRAAYRRRCRVAHDSRARCPTADAAPRRMTGRSACSTARTARPISSPTTTSTRSSPPMGGPLQLRPHRRPPDRPEARVGARRRRRGRAAPVQHPRQRLRRRHDRLHRRHAGHPRARRPEPGRLRLPGRPSSQAELWKIGQLRPGDTRALPPPHASGGGARWSASRTQRSRTLRPVASPALPHAELGADDRVVRASASVPAMADASSIGAPATTTCWSSTARSCSTSTCASASTRSMQARCSEPQPRRHHRPDARHPLAADPLRQPRAAARATCSPRFSRSRTSSRDLTDMEVPSRASCICRCPGTTRRPARHRQIHAAACAPTRPGARQTSSSSAASTASTRSTTCKRIVFDASYLVLGLGDVYLGAPVATPVDPRHRLVTTKYNPARTWTPENAVGIGGAYLCVYGMEGPGGYQFVGRTCRCGTPTARPTAFEHGKPWLLRFFDQIRFYPGLAAKSCSRFATAFLDGQAATSKIDAGTVPLSRLSSHSARSNARASPPSRRASRRPSRPSGRAGSETRPDEASWPATMSPISSSTERCPREQRRSRARARQRVEDPGRAGRARSARARL